MLHNQYFKVVLFFTSLIYFLRPRFIEPPTKPLFTPFTFNNFNLLGSSKRNASLLTQGLSHFQTSLCCNSSIFFPSNFAFTEAKLSVLRGKTVVVAAV